MRKKWRRAAFKGFHHRIIRLQRTNTHAETLSSLSESVCVRVCVRVAPSMPSSPQSLLAVSRSDNAREGKKEKQPRGHTGVHTWVKTMTVHL